ncbi:FGGY-family carbohydrate kinase [uncultured Tateyamaria sp.]|uniref:FGGY-family carbohydrate kinase n=1 Tax=uncultured Tateyamaria sp. TaxID=455651 RepID=UPI0026394F2B|nr:FGGY-family carbohydrate kinase [uncultured Tateyamaria sp.]
MNPRHIAVIDIGKTNAKLVLVDASDLSEIAVVIRPNKVLPGPPWPHFDVDGHWAFLLDGLREFQMSHGIDAISITTHGASAALLDQHGDLAAPILDYEHSGPDDVVADYDIIRPPFSETGSPRLPGGLNIGAQLFWQFHRDPDLKARTHRIVTYPQYWGAKLTGVAAMDVTSLGCHTDLWNPHKGAFSSLVEALGIAEKLPLVRKPSEVLGPILPTIAKHTGLPPSTPVYCGIHDSNASLLPYILGHDALFSVVSSGTWVIALSVGGKQVTLDPNLDTLINVTARGTAAPSARFMGGREHDEVTGGHYPKPSKGIVETVIEKRIMLMPAVVPETGPFKGQRAAWIGEEPPVGTAERGAAVGLYLALVTAECLANIGHLGPIFVEGPFAGNQLYLEMLAVAAGSDVHSAAGITGTSSGAALLATGPGTALQNNTTPVRVTAAKSALLEGYATEWRQIVRRRTR